MSTGLTLSLTSLGCLCVGGVMLYRANHKITWLKRIGASPEAERKWWKLGYAGFITCAIGLALIIPVLNNPKYRT